MKTLALLLFIAHTWFKQVTNIPINLDQKLFQTLFANHSDLQLVRPVNDSKYTVEVKMGIELQQLVAVDERQQFITTKVWVRQIWKNEYLTWNPKTWGGVDQLHTEAGFIWSPDIVLYNDAAENTFAGGGEKFKTLVIMHPNGLNEWNAPSSFKSTCTMNVKYFPFDTQICKMKFGSWAFDASKLQLKIHDAPLITEKYVNSSTWDVVDYKVDFNSVKYQCCIHPFHDITFTFMLKRRPMYYLINVIAPCTVLTSMVLFSFMLPAESRDRLAINITILLAVTVFLDMLGDMLPQTSETTPILSIFFISLMGMCGFTLITMIFVHTLRHRCNQKVTEVPPHWVRTLILKHVGPYLGYNTFSTWQDTYPTADNIAEGNGTLLAPYETSTPPSPLTSPQSAFRTHTVKGGYEKKKKKIIKRKSWKKEIDDILVDSSQSILLELTKMNRAIIKSDKQKMAESEWLMVSKVIDRLCLVTCFLMFVLSAATTTLAIYGQEQPTLQKL